MSHVLFRRKIRSHCKSFRMNHRHFRSIDLSAMFAFAYRLSSRSYPFHWKNVRRWSTLINHHCLFSIVIVVFDRFTDSLNIFSRYSRSQQSDGSISQSRLTICIFFLIKLCIHSFRMREWINERQRFDGQADAWGVIKRIEEISNSINNGFVQHVRLSCLRAKRKRKIQIYMCVRVDFCRWEQRLIRSFVRSSLSFVDEEES